MWEKKKKRKKKKNCSLPLDHVHKSGESGERVREALYKRGVWSESKCQKIVQMNQKEAERRRKEAGMFVRRDETKIGCLWVYWFSFGLFLAGCQNAAAAEMEGGNNEVGGRDLADSVPAHIQSP